jgi:hypothetical protein
MTKKNFFIYITEPRTAFQISSFEPLCIYTRILFPPCKPLLTYQNKTHFRRKYASNNLGRIFVASLPAEQTATMTS